jgi:hypothetical protein
MEEINPNPQEFNDTVDELKGQTKPSSFEKND